MKKVPIISISHRTYICKSIAHASDLIKLLSSLVPCSIKHDSNYHERWYEEDDERLLDIELKAAEEVRLKPRRLGLPAPKRGSKRCACGHSDVAPGHRCPSCNSHFDSKK